jgi:upstream activation factor subunit UAF30
MVKTKKTDAPATATEPKTPAKKATKVVKKAVTKETPVKEAAPVAVPPPAEAEPVSEENNLLELSSVFFAKLQNMAQLITQLKSEYRALEKKWHREIKQSQKVAKKKRKNGNRAPSGFVKPTRISDELAAFLGVDKGVEMARTDVTKEITAYIRAHSLQDKDNGRQINPDAKLKKLLSLGGDDVLTYFNLQKFMSPHFAKSVKAVEAAAAAAA